MTSRIETVYQDKSLGEKQPLWRNFFVGRQITNRFGFIDVKKEKAVANEILLTTDRLPRRGHHGGFDRARPLRRRAPGHRHRPRHAFRCRPHRARRADRGARASRRCARCSTSSRRDQGSRAGPASISSTTSPMCTRSPTGWSCSTAARSWREISPKDDELRRAHRISDRPAAQRTTRWRRTDVSPGSIAADRRAADHRSCFMVLVGAVHVSPRREVFLAPYHLHVLPGDPAAALILLAIGLTFVIGAGEIDLSFPAIIAFSRLRLRLLLQGIRARLARGRRRRSARGALVGFINGFLVARVGIPSIIATLATQFFWGGHHDRALRRHVLCACARSSRLGLAIAGRPAGRRAGSPRLAERFSVQALWRRSSSSSSGSS